MGVAGDAHAGFEFFRRPAKAILRDRPRAGADESLLQRRTFEWVLRTFRTRHTRRHAAQVDVEVGGIVNLTLGGYAEEALRPVIIFIDAAMFLAPAGGVQIIH